MKLKNAVGILTAIGAISLMCVSAQAATYTAKAATASNGQVVVPITVQPSSGEGSTTLNGYVVELTYDSTVLTPVQTGTDVTENPLYAASAITDGVFVSDKVDQTGDTDKVVVAWAAADAKTISAETQIASVTFNVINANAGSTNVGVEVKAAAKDTTTLETNNTAVGGTLTFAVKGDADGDGNVTTADALLIQQVLVEIASTDAISETAADADGDGNVTTADALLIQQYLVGIASTIG